MPKRQNSDFLPTFSSLFFINFSNTDSQNSFHCRERVKLGMSKTKMTVHELIGLIEAKKIVPEDDKTPYLMKSEVLMPEESPDGKLAYNLLLSSCHGVLRRRRQPAA